MCTKELWEEAQKHIEGLAEALRVSLCVPIANPGCKHIYGFREGNCYDYDCGSGDLVFEPDQVYVGTVDTQFTFCPLCGERLNNG